MCHIPPEPSVSPLLMGRSGRFSNSHSFTGMVSLSTQADFKTYLVKPMETTTSELFLFQQKFVLASFSFRLEDGKKKTAQSTQVSVHPAFCTHLTALKITFEVKTMRFFSSVESCDFLLEVAFQLSFSIHLATSERKNYPYINSLTLTPLNISMTVTTFCICTGQGLGLHLFLSTASFTNDICNLPTITLRRNSLVLNRGVHSSVSCTVSRRITCYAVTGMATKETGHQFTVYSAIYCRHILRSQPLPMSVFLISTSFFCVSKRDDGGTAALFFPIASFARFPKLTSLLWRNAAYSLLPMSL